MREGSPGMFNHIGHRYDLLNRIISVGLDRAWRARAAALCEGEVLDVCCGTGDMLLAVAARGLRVIGLDGSREFLALGREKEPGMRLVAGDALSLPFLPGSFDTVTMAWGMRNLAQRPRAAREAFRVLRPGGRLIVLDSMTPQNALRPFFRLYTRLVIPALAWLVGSDPGPYRYLARSADSFGPREAFINLLADAGFESAGVGDLNFGLAVLFTATKPR